VILYQMMSIPHPARPQTGFANSRSAILREIAIQRTRLDWSAESLNQYIADQYNGKRLSQFTDDELILLRLDLRQVELESDEFDF